MNSAISPPSRHQYRAYGCTLDRDRVRKMAEFALISDIDEVAPTIELQLVPCLTFAGSRPPFPTISPFEAPIPQAN